MARSLIAMESRARRVVLRRLRGRALIVASCIAVGLSLAACAGSAGDADPLVVGYLGGLSGRSSGLGLAGRDGALLAVEQANAAGGIDGRKIALETADDGTGNQAAEAGVRALAKAGAVAIVGPLTSVAASNAAPVAEDLDIPLVSPTVSSTDFTAKDDMFLRTCSDNREYGNELAVNFTGTPDALRAAVVYDLGNRSYTESLSEHFASALEQRGGSVVTTATFTSGQDPDYSELAKETTAKNPDVVFIVANSIDTALLAQRLRVDGYRGRLLLSHWAVSSDDLLETGGDALEGALFMDNYDRDSTEPEYRKMVTAFKTRFGYEPTFAAVHSFDATRMVIRAATKNPNRDEMKQTLLKNAKFKGLQDTFVLDRYGDTVRPFYPMTVRAGRFVSITEP